jgi:hypothetical protein
MKRFSFISGHLSRPSGKGWETCEENRQAGRAARRRESHEIARKGAKCWRARRHERSRPKRSVRANRGWHRIQNASAVAHKALDFFASLLTARISNRGVTAREFNAKRAKKASYDHPAIDRPSPQTSYPRDFIHQNPREQKVRLF